LRAYFAAVDELAGDLVHLLALAVGLPEDWFDHAMDGETSSMLLVNHYPALDAPPLPGQLRRGAHTDYGVVTILFAEDEPGLQISLDGEWLDVPAVPGALVVNLGDLMARWVNDRWRSTLHRVVVPASANERDRISIPYFVHTAYDAIVETAPTTITESSPAKYPAVRGGEWVAAKSAAMLDD
jgi:isopenicillin N synthase-like dioxygenase